MKKRKYIYNAIILIAGLVFMVSVYQLGSYFYQNYKHDQQKIRFQEYVFVPETKKSFEVDWNALQEVNSEIVAWIYIPGTEISYPVVQGVNNAFYLDHDFEKNYLYSGAIFMDAYADSSFNDKNTVIYGHNVLYGGMFSELEKYKEAAFFSEHPYIYILTPDLNYRCEIVAMYSAIDTSYSYQTVFNSETEYLDYLAFIQSSSLHPSEFTVGVEDKLITLSTCSYEDASIKGLRYVVQAKLVIYEDEIE